MTRPPRPGRAGPASEDETWAGWDLSGLVVDQLTVDYRLTLNLWGADRTFTLILVTPFAYRPALGESIVIDPEEPGAVVPALAVLHQPAESFRASSLGRCVLRFEDGTEIASKPHPDYEAWQSIGAGPLEKASLLAVPGKPGPAWYFGPPPP